MAQGTIIPFVSRSAVFTRGLMALCPSLEVLLEQLPDDTSPRSRECEWVLELLLRKLPYLPNGAGSRASPSVKPPRPDHWNDVLSRCAHPEVRAFASRCTAVLTGLLARSQRSA